MVFFNVNDRAKFRDMCRNPQAEFRATRQFQSADIAGGLQNGGRGELTGRNDRYTPEYRASLNPTVESLPEAGYSGPTPGLDMLRQNSGELRGPHRSESERRAAFLQQAAFMGLDPDARPVWDGKGNVAEKYCGHCGSWETEEIFVRGLLGHFRKRRLVCKSCGEPWGMRR